MGAKPRISAPHSDAAKFIERMQGQPLDGPAKARGVVTISLNSVDARYTAKLSLQPFNFTLGYDYTVTPPRRDVDWYVELFAHGKGTWIRYGRRGYRDGHFDRFPPIDLLVATPGDFPKAIGAFARALKTKFVVGRQMEIRQRALSLSKKQLREWLEEAVSPDARSAP